LQPSDAFWHLTNFFAPALVLGAIAAALTKLLWRRELGGVSAVRLWAWASVATAIAALVGLVVFERDGRMATYAGMVLACAAALWWAGFRGR
jgi:cation transport regulator ChaC